MPAFKKAILKVGTYHSPDGEVKVTPARLKHWANTHKTMRGRNLGVPVGWDHSDDPEQTIPISFATVAGKQSAKNAAGWLKSFDVAKDGQSAEITLDIPGATDAEKLENNVVEVSPIIYPTWKDGQGRTYDDCITHVDLVHHPVDASQTEFEIVQPGAIACGLRMGLSVTPYRMAEDSDMADDDKKKDDDKGDEDQTGNSGASLKALVDQVVEKLGVHMPEGVDHSSEAGMTLLLTAVLNKVGGDPADKDEGEEDVNKDTPPVPVPPDVTAMSLKANAAYQYAEKQHRLSLTTRLDSLLKTGRVTAAEAKQHKSGIGAVKLSLDAHGNAQSTDCERFIESREALPVNAAWQAVKMSATAVDQPDLVTEGEEITDERADEIIEEIYSRNRKAVAATAGK